VSKYKDLEARVANLEKLQRMLNYAIDGYNKSRIPVQEKPYTGKPCTSLCKHVDCELK
jgi:hypothetical protein